MHQPLIAPTRFVFAHTMLQIEHRITFLCIRFILCRCIDQAMAETLLPFGVISDITNLSVRNMLDTVIIPFLAFRHINAADHTATSEHSTTHRVVDRKTINHQRIVMRANHLWIGFHRPPAVFIPIHIISLVAQVHLKTLDVRRINTEISPVILVETWKITAVHIGRCSHRILQYILGSRKFPAHQFQNLRGITTSQDTIAHSIKVQTVGGTTQPGRGNNETVLYHLRQGSYDGIHASTRTFMVFIYHLACQ